jgi:hypothetical protein
VQHHRALAHDRPAQGAVVDRCADALGGRPEPALEEDTEFHAGVVAGLDHALCGCQVSGDGLFAEHVDSCGGGLEHHVLVGGVRGADRDDVETQP